MQLLLTRTQTRVLEALKGAFPEAFSSSLCVSECPRAAGTPLRYIVSLLPSDVAVLRRQGEMLLSRAYDENTSTLLQNFLRNLEDRSLEIAVMESLIVEKAETK